MIQSVDSLVFIIKSNGIESNQIDRELHLPVMATQVETLDGMDTPGFSKYVSTNSKPGYSKQSMKINKEMEQEEKRKEKNKMIDVLFRYVVCVRVYFSKGGQGTDDHKGPVFGDSVHRFLHRTRRMRRR